MCLPIYIYIYAMKEQELASITSLTIYMHHGAFYPVNPVAVAKLYSRDNSWNLKSK